MNICDHCFIEGDVVIGDNATIKCGVYLWNGILIENGVFIGPNATFTNDKLPRSKNRDYKQHQTILREGCSVGANATILPGITIGQYSMVGAGSVVTKSVPDYALVRGNQAKIEGYVCVCGNKLLFTTSEFTCSCDRKVPKN
ncbi:MAG: dTDP-3-amino-3,6-dideoxy-alpha-D-galactopyranose 3-N-acetyltransferase [Microgenomates bacterium OLB23]|nr:MAG: dTDP-3-amino-3,6-dideoxy-alpha-D-galactopyranose 3-N-acetyltransferase [Microgenomates bacterium OLB23]